MTSESSEAMTHVRGKAVPVRGDDIDTDRVIPARFLRCVTFEGLGEHAFKDDRHALEGEHPFDQHHYADAEILIVNNNFGCGSSREHAPQSLMRWGIKAVVGESFSEIFFGNCVALGLPCMVLAKHHAEELQSLVEEDPTREVVLSLHELHVRVHESGVEDTPVKTYPAHLPEGVRQSFLAGTWDATGQLLAEPGEIDAVAARLPYLSGFPAS